MILQRYCGSDRSWLVIKNRRGWNGAYSNELLISKLANKRLIIAYFLTFTIINYIIVTFTMIEQNNTKLTAKNRNALQIWNFHQNPTSTCKVII